MPFAVIVAVVVFSLGAFEALLSAVVLTNPFECVHQEQSEGGNRTVEVDLWPWHNDTRACDGTTLSGR